MGDLIISIHLVLSSHHITSHYIKQLLDGPCIIWTSLSFNPGIPHLWGAFKLCTFRQEDINYHGNCWMTSSFLKKTPSCGCWIMLCISIPTLFFTYSYTSHPLPTPSLSHGPITPTFMSSFGREIVRDYARNRCWHTTAHTITIIDGD